MKKQTSKTPSKKTAKKGKVLFATASELKVHALLEQLPVLDVVVERLAKDAKQAKGGQKDDKRELHQDNADTWGAFVADIMARNIVEPLKVVSVPKDSADWKAGFRYYIINGRHRFAGGKEAGLQKFPIEISQEDPRDVILGDLRGRNHLDKGQRAYFAMHLHPELIDSQRGKRTDLKGATADAADDTDKGNELPDPIGKFRSREDLAKGIGVSVDLVDLAARVHAMFRDDKKARDKYEPLVFAGVSLAGILRGDAAEKSDKGQGDERNKPWMRIEDRGKQQLKLIAKDWASAQEAGAEEVARVKKAFRGFIAELPAELREVAAETATDGGKRA
jgi:hypothetical protein